MYSGLVSEWSYKCSMWAKCDCSLRVFDLYYIFFNALSSNSLYQKFPIAPLPCLVPIFIIIVFVVTYNNPGRSVMMKKHANVLCDSYK